MTLPVARSAINEPLKQQLYHRIAKQQIGLDELLALVDRLDEPMPINPRQCGDTHLAFTPQKVIDSYSLIFNDEFNGALDPSKWNSRYPWGPDVPINQEPQYYFDTLGGAGQTGYDPFSFGPDGELIITADYLDSPVASTGQEMGSGVITTRDSCCFKYGYAEVCLQDPCCPSGMWSAAWLLNCMYYDFAQAKNDMENGGTGSDKFNFEIDFKESVDGFGCDSTILHALHYNTGDRTQDHSRWTLDGSGFVENEFSAIPAESYIQTLSTGNIYTDHLGNTSATQLPTSPVPGCSEPQVVGVDWCPGEIDFYVNGQLRGGIRGDIVPDQEMYLLLNLATGGTFPTQGPTPADYPAEMKVFWARIYAHPDATHTKGVIS